MDEWPEIMTPKQVAEYMQVNLKTVYALLGNGKLRGARVGQHARGGKAWRIAKDEVDRFLSRSARDNDQRVSPDELTDEEERMAVELLRKKGTVEPLLCGRPILAWRCTVCGQTTLIPEFATRGLNWPTYCSGCGMKTTLRTLVFEGRYEAAQPWNEDRRIKRSRKGEPRRDSGD